ncbi:MAG: UDP-N-acetylmuramoyl-L-alanyl-D-glutamate--2,6-diaminopimelate ligase [Methylotenera sp.]|nr:UDP-N-acetylmuramoyl-L-alanyl-D-glutamate--2,6-diaminopimelate ligase [Oligoflexia bacterium]
MSSAKTLGDLLSQLDRDNWVSDATGLFKNAQAISRVTSDSRQVGPGTLFIAVHGVSQDGHRFLEPAFKSGAVLAIGQNAHDHPNYLQVKDSRETLAQLAAELHGNPSHSLLMVGVTGTSGKTTTTYIIESILKAAGHCVGVIGTVNFRIGEEILPSTHTTPGAVELQELLEQMKIKGCTAVVMEVSSHALKQKRTAALAFDGVIFTNLSPEHLDFHPHMEDYFASKSILFFDQMQRSRLAGKTPFAAVNVDDHYGERLAESLSSVPSPVLHGFRVTSEVTVGLEGICGVYQGIPFQSELVGGFNASNILGALCVCRGIGISAEAITEGIRSLPCVPGRLEKVPASKGRTILIDYAHKPDALEKVLSVLEAIKGSGKLITVFGCGGDRDRTKRPLMGKIAVQLSDQVFITSDNPRTENPETIIAEILHGTNGQSESSTPVHVEIDRKKAIFMAVQASRPGDIILIAGKGHEDYQIIADPTTPGGVRKIHLDDREIASEALQFL